jgi:hypothetical protein
MSLIGNERLKLTAGLLNGLAIAMVAAGAIAPLAAFTYGIPGAASGLTVALIGIAWLIGGLVLHSLARWLLRGLKA